MIYLTKGQILKDNPGLVVYDPTGYYNDGDSVICAPLGLPEEPACRFEAKFVAYGGIVYSISDPDALMEQILAIDPKSLFGKDSQQIAVDKVVSEIVPQESTDLSGETPVDDASSSDNATTTPTVEQVELPTPPGEGVTSTTTPDVIIPTDPVVSTTTPDITLPVDAGDVSTATPEIITTPDPVIDIVVPAPDITSTTTALVE